VLPRERLERAIDDHPEIARLFLRHLARRVRHLVDRLDERSSTGVRARVARRLLEKDRASPGEWFALGRTQEELAEELGTVREVVARALSELRESGAAESDGRGRYRVIDSRLLERVTSGRLRSARQGSSDHLRSRRPFASEERLHGGIEEVGAIG
jgi:CRP/FNR family transcriptional regulator